MSKTPEQMAEAFANTNGSGNETHEHGLREGYIAGYQAAKDQLADADKVIPQWISVKERLPEDGDDLSIMLVWRSIESDYDTVRWRYQQGWDCVIQDKSKITHWMPLPKAPKGEG
jgi:hypothetical protein